MSSKYVLLLFFAVLIVGVATVNSACAFEDDFEGELTDHWDNIGSSSYAAIENYPTTYPTTHALHIQSYEVANGYTAYEGKVETIDTVSSDYFAFTMLQSTEYTSHVGVKFYIRFYQDTGAMIFEADIKAEALAYADGARFEFVRDGSNNIDLYVDGTFIRHLGTMTAGDDYVIIQLYCADETYGSIPSYRQNYWIDDFSTDTTIGIKDEWSPIDNTIVPSYAIKYKSSYPSSVYTLDFIRVSDSYVLDTVTGLNYTGFEAWDRAEYLDENYGLYKFELKKDGVPKANTYFTYKTADSIGSLYFDQDTYVTSETATITYSLSDPDFSTYTYEIEIINLNGQVLSTSSASAASGSTDVTFTDWDTGTYFVLFNRVDKSTGTEVLFAYDFCSINEAVKIEGNTFLFNGTAAGSADVSFLQGTTYYNSTSDATTGAYSEDSLSTGVATTCNASITGASTMDFVITPQAAGVIDLDLILFPDDMTDYWGTNNTTAYGMVYGTYHDPVEGATVTIYNDTWSDTTTTSSTGFYAFHGLVNSSSYSVNATKSGFRASNEYPMTTNNNVRQDIAIYELFTVTIDAEEDTYPILAFTAVFDGTAYESTAAGEVTIAGVEAGIYSLIVDSDGYYPYTTNVAVLGDKSVTAELTYRLSDSSSGTFTGSFTEPHTAEFIYLSYLMTRYPGVDVTVYEGSQDEVIEDGVPSVSAVEVMSMTTGDTGAVTFEMNKSSMYTLYAVSEDPAFTKITSLAPQDSRYYIFVGTNPFSSDSEGPVDNIYYGVVGTKLSLETAQINATFRDTSNSTTLAELWIEDKNGTQLYYDSTTDDEYSWSTTVDVDDNETYYVYFEIDSGSLSEPKLITKTFNFYHTVHPAFDLGFSEQWHYHVVAAFILVLIGGLFSVANGHLGMIVATIIGWIFVWIGYIEPSVTSGLAMTFATMVAGMMYIRRQERF